MNEKKVKNNNGYTKEVEWMSNRTRKESIIQWYVDIIKEGI